MAETQRVADRAPVSAAGHKGGQKRLLYIAAVLPPTRAPEADHILYQSLYFAERGIDVHVLTRSGQNVTQHPAVVVHDIVDSWSWPEIAKVVSLVLRLKPDAMMMSFFGSLYGYRTMPTMIPVVAKLLRPRKPFLVQFANVGQGGGLRSGVQRFLFRHLGRYRYGALLALPDAFVALSEEHRRKILALAPSAAPRIHIVPCCPQMPIASDRAAARRSGRHRLGIVEDDILVTFFGCLYPGKGIEQLVEAVGLLRPTFSKLRLGLIGGLLEPKIFFNVTESYEEELKACVRRHGMTDAGLCRRDDLGPGAELQPPRGNTALVRLSAQHTGLPPRSGGFANGPDHLRRAGVGARLKCHPARKVEMTHPVDGHISREAALRANAG